MGGRNFYRKIWLGAGVAFVSGMVFNPVASSMSFNAGQDAAISANSGSDSSQDFLINISDDSGAAMGAGAQNFVQNVADQAISFLSDEALSAEKKKEVFRKLLQDSFDMSTIGRFSLGRYWRVSTPEQRKEYQRLFEKMIIDVYSQRFSEYDGQRFEARSFRNDGPKDTLVTTFIVPESGPEIQVDWRVRHKDGQYRIVDVIVEGVSMSVTQRSDFSSVIQRGGGNVQVLLTHLRAL